MNSVLEMRHITKTFPGVKALDDVSIDVDRGEVRALVGENGAGKSTLIKILSGAYSADAGTILLQGDEVNYSTPAQALRLGIGAIYQEFNLAPNLSVAENVLLGQAPTRFGRLDRREMTQRAGEVLDRLRVSLDPRLKVGELDVAQQQVVEIARGLTRDVSILIMDEPTAALNQLEADNLFRVIRQLKQEGMTILFISHRLGEVFEVADSVTVLKDGKLVGTRCMKDVTEDEIVRMMIGRELTDYYPPKDSASEEVIFRVSKLNFGDRLHDIELELRQGEILGIAGLQGQGQLELVRVLFGDIQSDSGEFFLRAQPICFSSPTEAISTGFGFISDDRKNDGLVLIRSVRENISLPTIGDYAIGRTFIDSSKELRFVRRMIEQLDIRVSGWQQTVRNLSGGNQQKVVVGKWLGVDPSVLLVAEPTRGIDVGSKSEIHHILRDLARQGVGIIMVSSEMPEVLGMSDRILVMRDGRIVADLPSEVATEEMIMSAAANAREQLNSRQESMARDQDRREPIATG